MGSAHRPGGGSWRGFWTSVAILLAFSLVAGCGGGGGGGGTGSSVSQGPADGGGSSDAGGGGTASPPDSGGGPPEATGSAGGVTVRIEPSEAALEVGQIQVFTASVTGTADGRVRWLVREPGGGTVDGEGRYAAPPVPGTYHVEVWSEAEPSARASATVDVGVDQAWLAYVNYFRSLYRPAGARAAARRAARGGMFLPPVEEDPALSAALERIAQEIARTDPDELDRNDPMIRDSQIVRFRTRRDEPLPTARRFIEREIRNPFFRLWITSPFLQRVGYARTSYDSSFFVSSGLGNVEVQGTATVFLLNVLTGRSERPPSGLEFPLFFPGPDTVVPLLSYEGEFGAVDPLAHKTCEGYEPPTGLPITVLFGPDEGEGAGPDVTGTQIALDGGTQVEHCWYSGTTYEIPLPPPEEDPFGFVRGPLMAQMTKARKALGMENALVLIPREPLEPGRRYTITVTAGGQTYTWSFRTWPPPAGDSPWRLEPRPLTLLPGETVAFSAFGPDGRPIPSPRWLVNGMPGGGSQVGTITPGGTYRAPGRLATPRVVTVRAEGSDDPAAGAEATFTVAGIRVEVEPSRAVVKPGGSVALRARTRALPEHPGVDPGVDLFVEGIAGGSDEFGRIDAGGTYTAPDAAPPTGWVAVHARSRTAPWAVSGAEILFEADRAEASYDPAYAPRPEALPETVVLRLAPAVARVPAGGQVDFDVFPSAVNPWVDWSVEGAGDGSTDGVGTIDPTGLYTAPLVPPGQGVTVTARVFRYRDTRTQEAAVLRWTFQVVEPSANQLVLEPREARVALGATVRFAVEGVEDPADLQFEVDGVPGGDDRVGTIDGQGLYTAPASVPPSGNAVTVTARLRSAPWVWAEALVRLVGPLDAYLEPAPQRVALGARVRFAALVGGSPVPVDRWLVNGREGGGKEFGTISPDGVYQAPPRLPDQPAVITVRAEGDQIPGGAVETAFELEELVVTPPLVRADQGGLHEPVTVTARLSSGQELDLTGSDSVQVTSDHPEIAAYVASPEPGIRVPGDAVGTAVVRFRDLEALGRAAAAVVAEAPPRYRLQSYYSSFETARPGSVFPLDVYRVFENGPNAGSRVRVTGDPRLAYTVDEGASNTGIGYVDGDASRDPSTYTAVLVPSQGEIRVGELPGRVSFQVEDPGAVDGGSLVSLEVELLRPGPVQVGTDGDGTPFYAPEITAYAWSWDPSLETRDLEPRLQALQGSRTVWADNGLSAWSVPDSQVPVWVTPRGAPGFNGSAVLVVRADVPAEDALFARFRVDASKASFVPVGLSYARRRAENGPGGFRPSSQEARARYYTRDGYAFLDVPLDETYVSTSLPGLSSLGSAWGWSPSFALAEVVVHQPGPVDVTVEIAGTVQEPVNVELLGMLPPAYGFAAWPQLTVTAAGSAAEAAVAFPWPLYGLTPVVEYRLRGADGWARAEATAATPASLRHPLHDAPVPGPRVGGPGLSDGVGVTGFSAFFPLGDAGSDPWGGVFEIRVVYAEFPDEPVVLNAVQPPDPALPSGKAFVGDAVAAEDVAYVRVEDAVQVWSEAQVKPVRVCAGPYGDVRVEFPSADSYRNGEDAGAVSFSAPGQDGERVDVPAGGCAQLTPRLNVGLDPGDVIAGTLTARRLDAGGTPLDETALTILYTFTGAQVAVSPNLLASPPDRQGDLDAALTFRGGRTFGDALMGGVHRVVIRRDGQADLVVDGRSVSVVDMAAAEGWATLRFPIPAEYFETGAGPFRIRLELGPGGGSPFWAGPVEVGLLDVTEAPPLLPLNATWPGEGEPGVISGALTAGGTLAPFHLRLYLEQPGFDPPLVGFSRIPTAQPNRTRVRGTVRDLWITGQDTYSDSPSAAGRVLAYRIYGDRTDEAGPAGPGFPDGLPDRVSSRQGDLAVRITRVFSDGTERVIHEGTFTAFNFVARHPSLRAPKAAPVSDQLTAREVYDNLSFQVDESAAPGEDPPEVPGATREVWLYADNQIDLNSGVAGLVDLGYPGTSPLERPDPAVLDGRWGDFGGEPEPLRPERPRVPTGAAMDPFGVVLGGVCFDPWTFNRKRPNSDELLLPLFRDPVNLDGDGGFLYAQGGASGGWLAPPGFLLVARTPGADLPGLDCGYAARKGVDELSERFEDEAGPSGSLYTFGGDQGKRSIRTAVHLGGENAYFEVTTDPAAADGSPLCEAVLRATLVFSRAPVRATTQDLVLTVRQDRAGALADATAKVGVQVLASALAGLATAGGPVGIALSAGVAAAFQLVDNAGYAPFGVVDGAVAGTLLANTLQDAFYLTPATARQLWYQLAPSALAGRRVRARAARVAARLDEVLVSEALDRPDAWWVSPSGYVKSVVREATAGAVASVLASTLYDAFLDAEVFSANASAWAAVVDQLGLFIPEEAVVDPAGDTGLRGIWLARVKKRDLDLDRARALWQAIEAPDQPSALVRVEPPGAMPFYAAFAGGVGPATLEITPGGETAPSSPGEEPRKVADFRIRVAPDGGTRFPFVSTTVVEVGRSGASSTARAALDALDAELSLRVVDARIESVSVDGTTWEAPSN